MRKMISGLCGVLLTVGTFVPFERASAAPPIIQPVERIALIGSVERVKDKWDHRHYRHWDRRNWDRGRHYGWERRYHRRPYYRSYYNRPYYDDPYYQYDRYYQRRSGIYFELR